MNVGRRQVLFSLGAVASFAAVGGVSAQAQAKAPVPSEPPPAEPQAQQPEVVTQSPLGEVLPHGARLGSWIVERVHPVTLGAIPVVMRTTAGERFQVDILARDYADGAAQGVANTSKLSLFVANNGTGVSATSEVQGRGAMILGRYLALREAHGLAVPPLMTHADRNARYPRGNFMA